MNGDKLSTLHYLFTLAMQHSGIWVGTGLMPSNSKAAQCVFRAIVTGDFAEA